MGETSVTRALDILEYLSGKVGPAPAALIQRRFGIPKSSLHNLLRQLESRSYVIYHPGEHAWSLGPRLSELSAEAPLFSHAVAVLEAFPSGSSGISLQSLAQAANLSAKVVDRIVPDLEERRVHLPTARTARTPWVSNSSVCLPGFAG